eukprot:13845572-Alexandrium_andersonii.AAC.1
MPLSCRPPGRSTRRWSQGCARISGSGTFLADFARATKSDYAVRVAAAKEQQDASAAPSVA